MAEETKSAERIGLEKMRDDLTKEKADFLAQLEKLRQLVAETEVHIQRADGALHVVNTLLAAEPPAKPAKERKAR